MASEKEKQDLLIAGGIAVAVFILFWLWMRKTSVPSAQDTGYELTDPLSNANNPPSYNIPATLQLPPFNVGNDVSGVSNSGSGAGADGHCGCDSGVCGKNGSDYLSKFLRTMSDNRGINAGLGMDAFGGANLSPISPITIPAANVVGPPALNTYSVWRAKEGLDPPGPGNNNTHQRDSIPPGLTAQQQYKLYQLLNGGLFGNASIDSQNKAMAQIYDMPNAGPAANDSAGTGNNIPAMITGYHVPGH